MTKCFFVSDLHGSEPRFHKLFDAIERDIPDAVFLGGDLFPSGLGGIFGTDGPEDFLRDRLAAGFSRLKEILNSRYPAVFLILGNDDVKAEEERVKEFERQSLWTYLHNRCISWKDYSVYGYACVPPTPFLLKDWERYDVSAYLDPLCVAPEEGWLSVSVPDGSLRFDTIQKDLQQLIRDRDLSHAIFLFHTPPYDTGLDRAALDGKQVDYVFLDVHVGSIAVRRFIESKQPLLTLHGHVHESARITGIWKEPIGRTVAISAAHDGPELALVRFDPHDPGNATRELL
jgi:Icc-related predicted phosphoesterase